MLAILDPYRGPAGPYNFKKDTSHLLLKALAARGHRIFYASPPSLVFEKDGEKGGLTVRAAPVTVLEGEPWFVFHEEERLRADHFALILMRKDPPVDQAYLYTTQLLSEIATKVWIINDPQALRDWNEKLSVLRFPQWIPPTLVSANKGEIDRFVRSEGTAIAKPLEGFAGVGVKKLTPKSIDFIEILDEMTAEGTHPVMIQRFLPEVSHGEKRVFMVAGRPLGALLKIPPEGGFITNPDLGGRLAATSLTAREKRICESLAPFLKTSGIFFAGVDLIGERLTEINITSPGLVWEWNEVDNRRHEEEIIDAMERELAHRCTRR